MDFMVLLFPGIFILSSRPDKSFGHHKPYDQTALPDPRFRLFPLP
jgi:hypothetical protein